MKELAICFLAAAGFSWPLITRATNLNAQWAMLTVIVGTVIVAAINMASTGIGTPTRTAIIVGVVAGLANGLGFVAYSTILAFKDVDVTKVVSVTTAMIPVLTMLGAWLFFHEAPTPPRLGGIAAIALGIYLLR